MGLDIGTTRLYYHTARKQLLCDGLYLNAVAGKITGILGPSGAGKSVFLNLLTGYLRPSRGRVQVGDYDLHTQYGQLRRLVGYVPQAEIMIPELKVRHSLDYRLRLQCPEMNAAERRGRIEETCRRLGFEASLDRVLAQRIGRPTERGGNYPAGGQRRRINIAHELVGQPQVLFLDEPTSGLSAVDADVVMAFLAEVARQGLGVVMTIHQPSVKTLAYFRDILLVNWGGTMAYYGLRTRVVEYFERFGGFNMGQEENPAEFILQFVRSSESGRLAVLEFEQHLRTGDLAYLRTPLPD